MTMTEDPNVAVPGSIRPLPPPGQEAVGPLLTDLVTEMQRATRESLILFRNAIADKQDRIEEFTKQFQVDANGDGCVALFTVPAGAIGRIVICNVDEAGVTPANPDTNANLWHGIFVVSGGQNIQNPAQVAVGGSMRDAMPSAPTTDAMIPFTYVYGDRTAGPVARGGDTFYLVVDAATASRLIYVSGAVAVSQPDD